MMQSEHVQTRTYGGRGAVTRSQEQGLNFRDVLARDIRDVRSIVGPQYNRGIQEMIQHYRANFPDLIGK